MEKTNYVHVVKQKGMRGGMAHIQGSGVTVAGIVIMQQGGDSIDTIVSAYTGLTPEKVQEALDYYASNAAEVDKDIYDLTHPPRGYSDSLKRA